MAKTDAVADPETARLITDYIRAQGGWRAERLARLRRLVNEAGPDLVEGWKWEIPVWSDRGNVVAIAAFKEHVKINFFQGASLSDPHGLFNAGLEAKTARSIDFREGDKLDEKKLQELVRAAADYDRTKGK
jgi:hypothetical protein